MGDPELEAMLAAIRPEPKPEFVDSLERRLLGRPAEAHSVWRRSPLRIAFGGIAALAGVVVAISLAGLSPFAEDASVDALPVCTTTLVRAQVKEPVIVTRPDGSERIASRTTTGTKPVRVCSSRTR